MTLTLILILILKSNLKLSKGVNRMEIGENRVNGNPVTIDSSILRKHVALLGSTGSGKNSSGKSAD